MKPLQLYTTAALTLVAGIGATEAAAQEKAKIDSIYNFEIKVDLPTTSVKNQYKSGTCWSFSGLSFIESELLREKKGEYDLAEMFIVNRDYHNRAIDYVRWNGSKKFGAGAEGCNVFNRISEYGIVPQSAYNGLNYGSDKHMNNEMDAALKAYIEAIIENPNGKLSTAWLSGFDGILTAYLGEIPESFEYEGKKYTPIEFRDKLGIKSEDYIEFTSLTHHPLYSRFIMEVEDNWELGEVYNVSLDELTDIAFSALDNGYTVLWGGDVSEKGFSWNDGIAIVPDLSEEDMQGTDRKRFNQDGKKNDRNNLLLFLTDKNGTRYFKVKNSWDTTNPFDGYVYMSENFYRYKTLTVIVHKNAVPSSIKKKLKL